MELLELLLAEEEVVPPAQRLLPHMDPSVIIQDHRIGILLPDILPREGGLRFILVY